jgi:hypothetical protein
MTAEGKNLPAAETKPRWLDGRTHGGVIARASTPDFPIEYAVRGVSTCIQEEVAWTREDVRFALPAEATS